VIWREKERNKEKKREIKRKRVKEERIS